MTLPPGHDSRSLDDWYVALAFRIYLLTLPLTATAIVNASGVGVPLSYAAFAVFAVAFINSTRPLVYAQSGPVLAFGLFVAILVASSILSIATERLREAIRDAAFAKLMTQTAYWVAAGVQFWFGYAYLRSLSGDELRAALRFAALCGVAVAAYSVYQFLAFTYGW